MKYILHVTETTLEGKLVPGTYFYDNELDAVGNYERQMGNHDLARSNYNAIMCEVVREDGYQIIPPTRHVYEHEDGDA